MECFSTESWEQTTIFSPTCFLNRVWQISCKGFKETERKLTWSFNFTFRYIDDVLLLINYRFEDFVDRIYPIGHEEKETTNTARCASYLDLHLEIDSEGWLRTLRYDKRDDFNFPIVNCPFICSTIPAASAYLSVDPKFQILYFLLGFPW